MLVHNLRAKTAFWKIAHQYLNKLSVEDQRVGSPLGSRVGCSWFLRSYLGGTLIFQVALRFSLHFLEGPVV